MTGTALVEASIVGVSPVTADIDVVPAQHRVVATVDAFKFERDRYNVASGKSKLIRLFAPREQVERYGDRIVIEHPKSTGLLLRNFTYTLVPASGCDFFVAEARIEGRQTGTSTRLVARLGQLAAESLVQVRNEDDRGPIINIQIRSIPGYQRAQWDADGGAITITVNGIHPGAKRYFGPPPEFPDQGTVLARMLISEVVAEEAVRDYLRRKHMGREVDVDELYAERNKELMKLLPRCHSAQIEDAEIEPLEVNRGQSGHVKRAKTAAMKARRPISAPQPSLLTPTERRVGRRGR
ncbi:MAG: hypothetical protein M3N13_06175 [Candidatus Eremiobacteraeota bacterium]|nr:hypothetical protein [Candidatus Eremiobacteraeota bacterium]